MADNEGNTVQTGGDFHTSPLGAKTLSRGGLRGVFWHSYKRIGKAPNHHGLNLHLRLLSPFRGNFTLG